MHTKINLHIRFTKIFINLFVSVFSFFNISCNVLEIKNKMYGGRLPTHIYDKSRDGLPNEKKTSDTHKGYNNLLRRLHRINVISELEEILAENISEPSNLLKLINLSSVNNESDQVSGMDYPVELDRLSQLLETFQASCDNDFTVINYNEPICNDTNNNTLLHYVVLSHDLPCLENLLSKYSDQWNVKNKDGDTPLHLAIKLGYSDIVEKFIQYYKLYKSDNKRYIYLNEKNKQGNTPIHLSMICYGYYMASTKKDQFKNLNCNYKEVLIKLLCSNLDHEEEIGINIPNNYNMNIFSTAVQMKVYDMIPTIMANKALNLNQLNTKGYAPLHVAAFFGDINMLNSLIQCSRIEINKRTDNHDTAFHIALNKGNSYIAKLLLSSEKIDVSLAGFNGDTLLTLISMGCLKEIDLIKNIIMHKTLSSKITMDDNNNIIIDGKDLSDILSKAGDLCSNNNCNHSECQNIIRKEIENLTNHLNNRN